MSFGLAIEAETVVYDQDIEQPIEQQQPRKSFHYEHTNCFLEVPATWSEDTTSRNYQVLYYPTGEQDFYIGVRTYISSQPVTANHVYLRRAGSIWDRWHILGFKVYDEKDTFLVGVDEKVSGLYSRSVMNSKLQFEDTIVAEDIYIKAPDRVYIVTAKASKDKWMKYKEIIKEVLGSFYVEE